VSEAKTLGERTLIMSQHHTIRDITINYLTNNIKLDKYYAKDVEIGIFNWCLTNAIYNQIACNWQDDRFVNIYKEKSISILNNLNKNSYIGNQSLIEKLNNKEILPHQIAFMEYSQLYPEKWTNIIEDDKKKQLLMLNSNKLTSNTELFTCGKCKSKNCHYYEQCTRSADEAMTVFVTCLDCNGKWKC
jgi:DNA-directed RNA polymerase subunit M/transcription elongation factor TFIIS